MLQRPPRSTLFPTRRSSDLGVYRGGACQGTKKGRAFRRALPDMNQPALEPSFGPRSEEHTSELQSRGHLVCRLLLEKKKLKISKSFANCTFLWTPTDYSLVLCQN